MKKIMIFFLMCFLLLGTTQARSVTNNFVNDVGISWASPDVAQPSLPDPEDPPASMSEEEAGGSPAPAPSPDYYISSAEFLLGTDAFTYLVDPWLHGDALEMTACKGQKLFIAYKVTFGTNLEALVDSTNAFTLGYKLSTKSFASTATGMVMDGHIFDVANLLIEVDPFALVVDKDTTFTAKFWIDGCDNTPDDTTHISFNIKVYEYEWIGTEPTMCLGNTICSSGHKITSMTQNSFWGNYTHNFFFTPVGGTNDTLIFPVGGAAYCQAGNIDNVLNNEYETLAVYMDTATISQLWPSIDYTQDNTLYLNFHLISNDNGCNFVLDSAFKFTVLAPQEIVDIYFEEYKDGALENSGLVATDTTLYSNLELDEIDSIRLRIVSNTNDVYYSAFVTSAAMTADFTQVYPFSFDYTNEPCAVIPDTVVYIKPYMIPNYSIEKQAIELYADNTYQQKLDSAENLAIVACEGQEVAGILYFSVVSDQPVVVTDSATTVCYRVNGDTITEETVVFTADLEDAPFLFPLNVTVAGDTTIKYEIWVKETEDTVTLSLQITQKEFQWLTTGTTASTMICWNETVCQPGFYVSYDNDLFNFENLTINFEFQGAGSDAGLQAAFIAQGDSSYCTSGNVDGTLDSLSEAIGIAMNADDIRAFWSINEMEDTTVYLNFVMNGGCSFQKDSAYAITILGNMEIVGLALIEYFEGNSNLIQLTNDTIYYVNNDFDSIQLLVIDKAGDTNHGAVLTKEEIWANLGAYHEFSFDGTNLDCPIVPDTTVYVKMITTPALSEVQAPVYGCQNNEFTFVAVVDSTELANYNGTDSLMIVYMIESGDDTLLIKGVKFELSETNLTDTVTITLDLSNNAVDGVEEMLINAYLVNITALTLTEDEDASITATENQFKVYKKVTFDYVTEEYEFCNPTADFECAEIVPNYPIDGQGINNGYVFVSCEQTGYYKTFNSINPVTTATVRSCAYGDNDTITGEMIPWAAGTYTFNVHAWFNDDSIACGADTSYTLIIRNRPEILDIDYTRFCQNYGTDFILALDTNVEESETITYYWLKYSGNAGLISKDTTDVPFLTIENATEAAGENLNYYIIAATSLTCLTTLDTFLTVAENPNTGIDFGVLASTEEPEIFCGGTEIELFTEWMQMPLGATNVRQYTDSDVAVVTWTLKEMNNQGDVIATTPLTELSDGEFVVPISEPTVLADDVMTLENTRNGNMYQYVVEVETEDYNCPSLKDSSKLFVMQTALLAELDEETISICEGGAIHFHPIITGFEEEDEIVIDWYKDGVFVVNQSYRGAQYNENDHIFDYVEHNVPANQNDQLGYIYTCHIYVYSQTVASECNNVDLIGRAFVISDPHVMILGPTTANVGDTVTFQANVADHVPGDLEAYIWDIDYVYQSIVTPVDSIGETDNTFQYAFNTAGTYQVGVHYSAMEGGCGSSDAVNIIITDVEHVDAIIYANGTTQDVNACGEVVLSTNFEEEGNYTYSWYKDDENVANGYDATYTATESGVYNVVILDGAQELGGSINSVNVTITPAPTAAIYQQGNPINVSNIGIYGSQNAQTFEVRANDEAVYAYQWFLNNQPIGDATFNTYVTPADMPVGQYQLTAVITNVENGCEAAASVMLSVAPAISVSIDGPAEACEDDIVVLRATIENDLIGYTTIQWKLNGDYLFDDDVYSGTQTTELTIKVKDSTVVGEYAFEVARPGCENTLGYHDFDIFEAPDVDLTATIFCSNEATLTATVYGDQQPIKYRWYQITVNPTNDDAQDEGNIEDEGDIEDEDEGVVPPVSINAIGETYGNTFTVTETGFYFVEAVYANSNCNSISEPIQVEQGEVTQFLVNPQFTTVCDNGSYSLFVVDTNNTIHEDYNYQWYENGVAIAGATQPALLKTAQLQDPNGTAYFYYVGISGGPQCPPADQQAVVFVEPNMNVAVVGAQTVCEGSDIELQTIINNAIADTLAGYTYQWNVNSINYGGVNVGSTTITDTTFFEQYDVAVADGESYRLDDTLFIAVAYYLDTTIQQLESDYTWEFAGRDTVDELFGIEELQPGPGYYYIVYMDDYTRRALVVDPTINCEHYVGAFCQAVIYENRVEHYNYDTIVTPYTTYELYLISDSIILDSTSLTNSFVAQTGLDTDFPASDVPYMISVEVTNGTGCTAEAIAIPVLVQEAPTVTVQISNPHPCPGTEVTVSAEVSNWHIQNLQFAWNTGHTTPSFTTVIDDSEIFDVTVTDRASGCTANGAAEASVRDFFDPIYLAIDTNLPAEQYLCEGTAVELGLEAASDELSYQWYANNIEIPGATLAELTHVPTVIDGVPTYYQYTVVVTSAGDEYCQGVPQTVTVNFPTAYRVMPPAVVNIVDVDGNAANQALCAGESYTLTAEVLPDNAIDSNTVYHWFNQNYQSVALGETLVVDSAVAGVHNYILVINENTNCQVVSAPYTVTVGTTPDVALVVSNGVICENGTTNLSVFANEGNVTDYNYAWKLNDEEGIYNSYGLDYTPEIVGDVNEIPVEVTVTNPVTGCEITLNDTIYIANPSVEIAMATLLGQDVLVDTINTINNIICEGESIAMIAFTDNDSQLGTPTYQWFVNGQAVAGATTDHFVHTPVVVAGDVTPYIYEVQVHYPAAPACAATTVAEAHFLVRPNPVVLVTGDNVVCAGETVTLNSSVFGAVDSVSYQWIEDGVEVGTDAQLIIENIGASDDAANGVHTYVLVVNEEGACQAVSNLFEVRAVEAPVVNLVLSDTIGCMFNANEIVATAHVDNYNATDLTYEWFVNDEALPFYEPTINYTTNASSVTTETIVVKVTQLATGCTATDTAIFHRVNAVVEISELSEDFEDVVICEGAQVELRANIENAEPSMGAPTYQWYVNGRQIPGATTEYLLETPQSLDGDSTYYYYGVKVTYPNFGCVIDDTLEYAVVVRPNPVVVITGDNVVCENDDLTLVANGIRLVGENEITWYHNGVQVDAMGDTLVIEDIEASTDNANGVHTFVAIYDENGACQARSQIFNVTVNAAPVVNVSQNTYEVCEGGEVVFVANLDDNTVNNVNYQWYQNDEIIPGAVYPNLTVVAAAESPEYKVVVTQVGSACTAESEDVAYVVVSAPEIAISVDVTDICTGAMVTVTVDSLTEGLEESMFRNVYTWTINGQVINGVHGTTYTTALTTAGTYTYEVTLEQPSNYFVSGCVSAPASTVVTVHEQPEVFITPDNGLIDVCEGGSISLDANSFADAEVVNGARYDWRRNGASLATNTPSIITDATLPAGEYTYTVVMTSQLRGCRQVSDMIHTHVVKQPQWTRNIVTPTEICEGSSVTLYAQIQDGLGGIIQWSVVDTAGTDVAVGQGGYVIDVPFAGVYEYYPDYIAFGNGCELESGNSTFVTVYERPTATAVTTAGSDIICLGESADIEVSFTGSAPYTYSLKNMMTGDEVVYTTTTNPDIITVYPQVTTIYEIQTLSNGICEAYANAATAIVPVVVSHIEFTDAIYEAGCDTADQNAMLTFNVISGGGAAQQTYTVYTVDGVFVEEGVIDGNFITIDMSGFATGDHDFIVDIDACDYPVTVRKNILGTIIEQRWDDVLVCNNNSNNNGGYTFISYQWYKNGAPITGATGQYYNEVGGLNGEYYLWMKDVNGREYWSCPQIFTNEVRISVYPNPANVNQEIIIELPLSPEELEGGVLDIYDAKGALVQHISVLEPITKVEGFKAQGAYFGRILTGTNDVKTVKFIIVK